MKRAIGIIGLCLIAATAGAVDIGADFIMTNFGFPWEQTVPFGPTARPSPASFLYGGGGFVKQSLTETLSIATAYRLDPLSRSWLSAMVSYSAGALEIGLGSQFGVFNNLTRPLTAGLSSSIKVEIPGLIFASVQNSSSLGQTLGAVGDNSQEFNDIRVGWYVRNAICSAILRTEKYQERREAGLVTTDSVADYIFQVDIFKKNQPYNIILTLGYKTTAREWIQSGVPTKDSLGSMILGTRLKLRPAPYLELDLGLESGVYTFGFDDLLGHGSMQTDYFFKGIFGLTLRTSEFRARGDAAPIIEKLEDINVQPAEPAPDGTEPPGDAAQGAAGE
jgi:hypothetical protein